MELLHTTRSSSAMPGNRINRAFTDPARCSASLRTSSRRDLRHSELRTGFTLIELMVVIAIIILIAATALPTMVGLFTSGQDQQAFNILSAQLSAARALAITNGAYTGVHVQMADNPDSAGKCYAAVVIYSAAPKTFQLAEGYQPVALPGSMAFGQIGGTYVTAGSYNANDLNDPNQWNNPADWPGTLAGFTTFTIVFNPAGEAVTNVNDQNVSFGVADTALMKNGSADFTSADDTRLWRIPNPQPGAQSVTMFDYKTVRSMDRDDRKNYLDENGQFLALNVYTGKFFARE